MKKKIVLKHGEDYYLKVLMQETKVQEIMTAPVIAVNVHDPFHKIVDLFREHGIRHLPVVNNENKVVGMITERYLYKIHSPRKLENGQWYFDPAVLDSFILEDVMIQGPYTLKPEQSLGEAIELMVKYKCGGVPVVDDKNHSVGMLTYYDILAVAVQILRE